MLSGLANLLFGNEKKFIRDTSPTLNNTSNIEEDEWVLVSCDSTLTFSALKDSSNEVTGSSLSVSGEIQRCTVEVAPCTQHRLGLSRAAKRYGGLSATCSYNLKNIKSAQLAKVKVTKSAMGSKNRMERRNKCVKIAAMSGKQSVRRQNLPIKASGCKQIKQC